MSTEQKKAANVLVIEIVNQQPSNYFLDGAASEDSDLPSVISAPNARKIKNTTKIKYMDNGVEKLKKLRYIKGCDEIEVDKQNAAGYVPNPSQDAIWILNGKLTVVESGTDVGLYRYLRAHENNVSNPDRPDNAVGIFHELDTNVDAMKIESLFDEEAKILKYLSTLKKEVKDGVMEYNHDVLEFLCSLFKLPAYDKNAPSESWVNVAMFAKANPKKFFNGLANKKSLVEAEVRQSLEMGVVSIDDTRAFFDEGNKTIIGFKSTQSNDEKVVMLIDHMANPKNRIDYDHLRGALHQKKINAGSVVQ